MEYKKAKIANSRFWVFWGGLLTLSIVVPFIVPYWLKPKTSDEKKEANIPVIIRIETPKPIEPPIAISVETPKPTETPVATPSDVNQQ